ncbi:MAG: hypothetical protein ACYTG5_13530 [Planctomycetota bacterium]|jgi:hypothetical protein
MMLAELLLLILVPTACGWACLRCMGLGVRSDAMGFIAWAYVAGCLVMAPALLAWALLGKPVNGLNFGLMILALALLAGWLVRRKAVIAPWKTPRGPGDPYLAWITVGMLGLLFFDQTMSAALTPVSYGDEANIWAAKAHVLFEPGAAGREVGLQQYVLHADYPLLNPLIQVWAFAVHGGIDPYLGRIAIQIYVFAMILATASAIARHSRGWLVPPMLLMLFVNENSLQQVTWACADLMLACGMLVAADSWLRWLEEKRGEWLSLHLLGLCTVLWSKNEGLMIGLLWFLIILLPLGVARSARARLGRGWILQVLPCLAVVSIGMIFNAAYGLGNDLFNSKIGEGGSFWQRMLSNFGERLGPVASRFTSELLDPEEGRLIILSFLILALGMGRAVLGSSARPLLLLVIGGLAGYMAVFIATNRVLDWHLETAADRVIYHLTPVASLGLAILLKQQLNRSLPPPRPQL